MAPLPWVACRAAAAAALAATLAFAHDLTQPALQAARAPTVPHNASGYNWADAIHIGDPHAPAAHGRMLQSATPCPPTVANVSAPGPGHFTAECHAYAPAGWPVTHSALY